MDRRRLTIVALWVAALAAVAAITWNMEPDPRNAHTRSGSADTFVAGESPAPATSRLELAVAHEAGSNRFYRGGPRHTARSPFRGPSRARVAFSYRTGGRVTAQAVEGADGTLYVGSHDHRLHAIAADGTPRWTAEAEDRIWSSALVLDDGAVAVGSDDGGLYLFEPSGALRWRIRAAADADGPPALGPDGTLYFTAGPYLHAVDVARGEVRWRFQARGPFLLAAPAVDRDGTIYVGSIDNHLYAIAPDGRTRWEFAAEDDISSSPVIGDDGSIFFGSDDHHVYALDRDGHRRWRANVDGYVRAPVALGRRGEVIVGVYGPQPKVMALDAADGDERWFFPVTVADNSETGIASGPLVDADGDIYFGSQDDFVYSLSADGHLRWIHQIGADIDAAPLLTEGGLLIIGADDGTVYAIGEEGGADDDEPARQGADGPAPAPETDRTDGEATDDDRAPTGDDEPPAE